MKSKIFILTFGAFALVTLSLSGCALFAVGAGAEAGYVAAQDDKSVGETIDDQLIVSSVKTKLLADPDISGLNINVDSHKGIVTLRGYTETNSELNKAVNIASNVSGVRSVISKLSVQH